jgi:segregation and condensation protein A
MTHTVSIGEFEGPLGILLELVERGNVEVTAISVAEITAQYLDRIRHLPGQTPEHLSEFLELGARLLYIKSLALLPGETTDERAGELARLTAELEEYRRFQHLARELGRRGNLRTWERRVAEQLDAADLPMPRLALAQLAEAFTAALRRAEPAPETTVIPAHISLEATMKRLRARLASAGSFELQALLSECRQQAEIIVTFLALLELIRSGTARVTQAKQFAPITVLGGRTFGVRLPNTVEAARGEAGRG